MFSSIRARLVAGALGVAVAAALNLGVVGGPANVYADECGSNNGNECWKNRSCIHVLFYSQCTTKSKYYHGDD